MIFIGIDTGATTGIAVWDSEKKELIEVRSSDFWGVHDYIFDKYHDPIMIRGARPVTVIIELPGKFLYRKNNKYEEKVKRKIAVDYGGTRREAELLQGRFESLGFKVILLQPGKKSGTKMKAPAFKKLTGWKERTNEHGRDAAMLVFGR